MKNVSRRASVLIAAMCFLNAVSAFSAKQVLMTKEGDPTEYEVLLSLEAQPGHQTLTFDELSAQMASAAHGVKAASLPQSTASKPVQRVIHGPATQVPTAGDLSLLVEPAVLRGTDEFIPDAFNSLSNAVRFIKNQRGRSGTGLPATFYVPSGMTLPSDRNIIIREGVGLYDTALSLLALIEDGSLKEAGEILDIFRNGVYGNMDMRAFPNGNNQGAFAPFDSEAYYFFDFTRANGVWGPEWTYWTPHTGPNAWLVIAVSRYIEALRGAGKNDEELAPYLKLAETVGKAMLRLQTEDGGIRFAPKGTYFEPGASDPYLEVNSENNISAYAALNALARVTGKQEYRRGADDILRWFKNAPGLFDAESGMLRMGAVYKNGAWEVQQVFAADSGGTWTISSIGADTIDALWGDGTAYKMWRSTRDRMGRTAERLEDGSYAMHRAGADERLDGLDFSQVFGEDQALISPEWTGGGIFALKQLVQRYEGREDLLSTDQLDGVRRDIDSMQSFLSPGVNSYAVGPGMTGEREGRTGFGWYAPPEGVSAMASIYSLFSTDPLAWTRSPRE
jgi:hypothetical protein